MEIIEKTMVCSPMQETIYELFENGKENTYVFIAPEIDE